MSTNAFRTPEMIATAEARQDEVPFAEARQSALRPLPGADALQPAPAGAGITYRHDWGLRRGQWMLQLDWAEVDPRSQVFVAVGEGAAGGPDAGKLVGAARCTVHSVAPRAGGVDIWVNIEWDSAISLYADYLVMNPAGVTGRKVQVTVQRHDTVPLSDADADRILGDMGATLQSADSASDIATRVQFVRNGPVQVLPPTVPRTIQTEADLVALLDAGSGIKLVQAIRWCGGPGGSIIGCAPLGSPSVNVAAVRFTPDQEGILWVHEYGHNAGLGHRTDDRRAIMYPSIASDHNVVNAAESERFLAGPAAVSGAVPPSSCSPGVAVPPPQDVRAFVSQHWIQGVPYQAASHYTEEDAKQLLAWLVDEPEQHEEFLPEIVTTLCFIGSEVAVAPLIEFMHTVRASQARFNAKNAVLIHLGDLVNKSGSQAALAFLVKVATDMETARTLAVPRAAIAAAEAAVAGVAAPTTEALAAELAVSATFGLALAGRPDAEQTILQLQGGASAFSAVNAAAAEAAKLSQTVRAMGQEAYYRMRCEGGHRP
ncbi:hypothetical protein ACFPOU_18555 [Massilia jejuensis]|uniref:Peptidase M11 gametolysin domain-containing protein n=1 Tax=Massilia jejuensis TaxID=648894 RepID=A0ABW0PKA4_9BURK